MSVFSKRPLPSFPCSSIHSLPSPTINPSFCFFPQCLAVCSGGGNHRSSEVKKLGGKWDMKERSWKIQKKNKKRVVCLFDAGNKFLGAVCRIWGRKRLLRQNESPVCSRETKDGYEKKKKELAGEESVMKWKTWELRRRQKRGCLCQDDTCKEIVKHTAQFLNEKQMEQKETQERKTQQSIMGVLSQLTALKPKRERAKEMWKIWLSCEQSTSPLYSLTPFDLQRSGAISDH